MCGIGVPFLWISWEQDWGVISYSQDSAVNQTGQNHILDSRMGRTIPSWRIVVDRELEWMRNFGVFLREEDRIIFEDMMLQCKLYASYASTLCSPIKEVPLLISMIYGQHKMLWEHEKILTRLKFLEANKTNTPNPSEETKGETEQVIETITSTASS